MSRYIAVQRSETALFAYVEVASRDELEAALITEVAQWATPGDYRLDTSRYASETTDDLAVYEVPADLVYDADMIDAHDVQPGRIFENYVDFNYIGYLADVSNAPSDEHSDEDAEKDAREYRRAFAN